MIFLKKSIQSPWSSVLSMIIMAYNVVIQSTIALPTGLCYPMFKNLFCCHLALPWQNNPDNHLIMWPWEWQLLSLLYHHIIRKKSAKSAGIRNHFKGCKWHAGVVPTYNNLWHFVTKVIMKSLNTIYHKEEYVMQKI